MKLYPRKINSVKDLKQERKALKSRISNHESDEWFSFGGKGDKEDHANEKHGNKDILSTIGHLFYNNPFADIALSLGAPLLKKTGKSAGKTAFTVAKELIGGYAKWKAIELGYRWVRRMIKKRKEHSEKV